AEDGIRDFHVTGVQTCALPICGRRCARFPPARRSAIPNLPSGSAPLPPYVPLRVPAPPIPWPWPFPAIASCGKMAGFPAIAGASSANASCWCAKPAWRTRLRRRLHPPRLRHHLGNVLAHVVDEWLGNQWQLALGRGHQSVVIDHDRLERNEAYAFAAVAGRCDRVNQADTGTGLDVADHCQRNLGFNV